MPTAINHKSPQSGGVVRSSVRLFERLTGCRDVPLFQELVKENEGLRQLAKELRSSGEKLQRQQEEELRKLYERKFADQKAKCKQEVMKVVDSQKSQLKRSYDDRLHTVVKVKEKEIQTLQKKLTQSQEQLLSRSRDSLKFSPKIGEETKISAPTIILWSLNRDWSFFLQECSD